MHMRHMMMPGILGHAVRSAILTVSILVAEFLSAAIMDYSGPVQPVQVTQTTDRIQYQAFDPARGVVEGQDVLSGFINLVQADGVLAWSDSTQVRLRAYDPSQGTWKKLDVPGVARTDLQTSQGVVTWSAASRVYMAVYDQTRHEWRGADLTPFTPPLNLTTAHGIVTWSSSSQFSTAIQYVAYNPVTGMWMDRPTQFNQVVSIQNLSTRDGVVAWSVQGTVYFRTFDPVAGAWVESSSTDAGSIFDLVIGDGIVTWSQSSLVRAVIFDPIRNAWRGTTFPPAAFVTNLRIASGSVLWSGGGTSRTAGYNVDSGNWGAGLTLPKALLGVSKASGNAPLDVYFFDQSLGASTWSWNFGDGTGSSSRRSPYHRFEMFGSNSVTLTVSSPTGGVFTATRGILSDIEKPSGTLLINNGEDFTTNALVTLTLTAVDNSGVVQSMRFSNDGGSWSAWEPFALSKPWIVASAMGTNIVFAQFQDRALNVSDPASDTISVDSTPQPTIQFAQQNYLLPEGTNSVAVEIRLSHSFGRPVAVDVFSTESTAMAGLDFEAVNQRITFTPGQTSRSVSVEIIDDADVELNETFFLSLANPTNGLAGGPATFTIVDDDLPSVSFATNRFSVLENVAGGEAIIAVRLSSPTGSQVEVDYLTMEGTAMSPVDYEDNSGRLVFLPGETEKAFAVLVLQDSEDEFPETVSLILQNPTNAPLGAIPNATLEILDDDPPRARFASASFKIRENDPNGAPIRVELSSPFDQTVDVNYALTAITATAGGDYFNIVSPLRFLPGQTNVTFFVNLNNDSTPENDESLRIALTGFNNATAGSPAETILTIEDDDRPRFHSSRLTDTGEFETQLSLPFGINIQVETSTNSGEWMVLTNVFNAPTNILIVDTNGIGSWRRYYRALIP